MEAELAALASSGATALVGLMVTDSWTQVKEKFARLLARLASDEMPLKELEASRVQLVTAYLEHDDTNAAAVENHWRTRLESLLCSDESAADELRRLLDALAPHSVNPISNFNSGNAQFGAIIQAGHISGASFHIARTSGHGDERRDSR